MHAELSNISFINSETAAFRSEAFISSLNFLYGLTLDNLAFGISFKIASYRLQKSPNVL